MEAAKKFIKERGNWNISFVRRDGNEAAHLLAKHGLMLLNECIWIEDVPNVIADVVLDDITNQRQYFGFTLKKIQYLLY